MLQIFSFKEKGWLKIFKMIIGYTNFLTPVQLSPYVNQTVKSNMHNNN